MRLDRVVALARQNLDEAGVAARARRRRGARLEDVDRDVTGVGLRIDGARARRDDVERGRSPACAHTSPWRPTSVSRTSPESLWMWAGAHVDLARVDVAGIGLDGDRDAARNGSPAGPRST